MPGTVIGTSLNLGYAGRVSSNAYSKITSRLSKSILDGNGAETLPDILFGSPVVVNADNTYSKFGATGTGVAAATLANFGGFAVAEVKQMATWGNVSGSGAYSGTQPVDVIQQGEITVFVKDGTPATNGQVYVCTVAGGAIAVGDIVCSTTPTGGGTGIALTNVKYTTGKKDANGISEIVILTQLNA